MSLDPYEILRRLELLVLYNTGIDYNQLYEGAAVFSISGGANERYIT